MKTTQVYRTRPRKQLAKKPRRYLLFVGFICAAILLFCGYDIVSFINETSTPPAEAVSTRKPVNDNTHLAWPANGQAAIGTVEDGLLARSSNTEKLRPTASMAKVIAALAIMKKQPFERGEAGRSYVLTARDVENYRMYAAKGGSVIPVYEGMKLTQYQAMQAMLIPSANNIAKTLVEKVFGSEEAYISYAQDMLKDMKLNRTVVDDASGFSSNTASTPSELVEIGITALKNPVIAEIVAQPRAQIPNVGIVDNTNDLLGISGVIGIKTGTTNSAGSCLLFAARYVDKDGKNVTVVGVIMGDTNAPILFSDSEKLLVSMRQSFGFTGSHTAGSDSAPLIDRPRRAEE